MFAALGDPVRLELARVLSDGDEPVAFENTGAADGMCNPRQKRVAVPDHLEWNGRLATLIHDLAHAIVAIGSAFAELSYAQGELTAESVAF